MNIYISEIHLLLLFALLPLREVYHKFNLFIIPKFITDKNFVSLKRIFIYLSINLFIYLTYYYFFFFLR